MEYTPMEFNRQLYEELDVFDPGWSFDEYREKVLQSLIYCMSWPEYKRDHALAAKMVKERDQWIRDGYAAGEDPNSVAADVGYCCG